MTEAGAPVVTAAVVIPVDDADRRAAVTAIDRFARSTTGNSTGDAPGRPVGQVAEPAPNGPA